MEQLRADLRRVQEEFKNLKSITTSFFKSLNSQQGAQPRLHTTQPATGQLRPRVLSTETLERSLLDAYSHFEKRLEEFDRKIGNALSSANTTPSTPSGADSPTSNASPSPDSASTSNTSLSADSPLVRDASPRVDLSPSTDTPAAREPHASADSPLIGNAPAGTSSHPIRPSRTPLPSAPRPAQHPGSRVGDGRTDAPNGLPDAPPDPSPDPSPKGPGHDKATKLVSTLSLSDLGERLILELQTFIQNDVFTSKLLVEDIGLAPTALLNAVPPLDTLGFDAQYKTKHRLDEGTWHLYMEPFEELQLPDFTKVAKPSEEDAEQYLEDLCRTLPEEPVPYYIGPLSGPVAEQLQSYFPSGHEVSELGDVPGVSTLYAHIGEAASGTAFHCEDANLRSYNLTLIGWKIWILIKPHHTTDFEDLVRRLTSCDDTCDQFVRHTSFMVPPSTLRAENIEFDVFCSGPGEMVLTQPRQYHAVINRTASFAIATNFVLPNEEPIPKGLSLCHLDGLYHLQHPMVRRLRHAKRKHASQPEAPSRKKRPRPYRPLGVSIAEALLRETTSQNAVLRFITVVRAWRNVGDNIRGELLQIGKYDESNQLKALDTLRTSCRENSQLFSFLEILACVHLVRKLERRITVVAPEAIDGLLDIRGLPHIQRNRRAVRNELTAYQKWDQLCGAPPAYTYEGILCFMPPVFKDYQEVTRTQVQQLNKDDIALFCSMLQGVEYAQRLYEVGKAFQMGIFGLAEFKERPFEAQPYEVLSTLDLADLLRLL